MARVPNVASERPTTEDAVTTDQTLYEKYEAAGMALAYHVSNDMQYAGTLTQLSLDAIDAYRAAQAAWYAEINVFPAKKEAA